MSDYDDDDFELVDDSHVLETTDRTSAQRDTQTSTQTDNTSLHNNDAKHASPAPQHGNDSLLDDVSNLNNTHEQDFLPSPSPSAQAVDRQSSVAPSQSHAHAYAHTLSPHSQKKHRYRASVDLKSIKGLSTNHSIFLRYIYPLFGAAAPVITRPPTEVRAHSETPLSNAFSAFEFVLEEDRLQQGFEEDPLIIEVYSKNRNAADRYTQLLIIFCSYAWTLYSRAPDLPYCDMFDANTLLLTNTVLPMHYFLPYNALVNTHFLVLLQFFLFLWKAIGIKNSCVCLTCHSHIVKNVKVVICTHTDAFTHSDTHSYMYIYICILI